MPLRDFDLREVYGEVDRVGVLSAETVGKYFLMGAEGLLAYVARNPIKIEIDVNRRGETTITDGNHRAKALLKHDIYVVACEFEVVLCEPISWSVSPIKLVDIPEVEEDEYKEYLKEF